MLVHGGDSDAVSVAMGGTGKTQLAVEFTQALRNARAVDVLIWVTASSRDTICGGFARADGAVARAPRRPTRATPRSASPPGSRAPNGPGR